MKRLLCRLFFHKELIIVHQCSKYSEGDHQQLPLAMALRELAKAYRNALGVL